ncbi:hypothetical protein Tco_0930891 [Tanacetum coccineum]
MSEEYHHVDVGALPKFDMPLYGSEMTAKDVKSLSLRHGIPPDLHPVALTKEWTMDKLSDDMIGFLGIVPSVNLFRVFYKISKQGHWFSFEKRVGKGASGQIFRETFSGLKGWKKQFFFLDRRAIPDAMAWRHHDSDVNDPVLEDGFNASDVQLLTKQIVDLRPVPSGLLFQGGLATTWDFPGFRPTFKDIEGNVVTMSKYLRFPFLSGASISKGPPLTSQNPIKQHTTCPLPLNGSVPEKTDHQKRVEVEDPKIIAIRERKARAAAKKREKQREGGDDGGGPIRTFNPNQPNPSDTAATTAESQEDRSPLVSPRGSAAHSINYYDAYRVDEETDTLRLGTSRGQTGKVLTNADTEVVRPSPVHHSAHHSPPVTQMASPLRSIQRGNVDEGESSRGGALYVPDWSIHRRCRLDTPAWCHELLVHLGPPAAQEESNALNNATALDRAWFSLARGALAQSDILERFEHLQTNFDRLAKEHAGCEDTVRKLVSARKLSQQNSRLYVGISKRFRKFKNDHANCPDQIRLLED